MGRYDYVDREYFTDPERAAELFSAGVYHWRLRLGGKELRQIERTYPSMNSNPSGQLERDAIFVCERQRVKYGLEFETHADYGMPRRFLTYDACEYAREAETLRRKHEQKKDLQRFEEIKSGMRAGDTYYPVINLVLYLGRGHFRGRESLRELFSVSPKVKPYVFEKIQNYTYALLEAEYLDPEEFRTDLKYFFRAMQCRNDKKKLKELLEQEAYQKLDRAAQKAIAVHLNIKKLVQKVVEEEKEMCKAYRDLIADERAEARQEGIQKGIQTMMDCLRGLKNGRSKEELIREGFDQQVVEQVYLLIS